MTTRNRTKTALRFALVPIVCFVFVAAAMPGVVQAGTFALIDLGGLGNNDFGGTPPSPDANGNHWNTLRAPGYSPTSIADLNDSTGSLTGWGVAIPSGQGESGWCLLAAPTPFDIPEVWSDNFASGGAGGSGHQAIVFNFTGLDSSLQYEFTLWGERDSAAYGLPSPHDPTDWANGDIQVTTGTAVGGPAFTLLQSTLLEMTITPDAGGNIDFTADWTATPGGNWLQINVMSIEEVPEPATLALLGLGGLGLLFRRRRR